MVLFAGIYYPEGYIFSKSAFTFYRKNIRLQQQTQVVHNCRISFRYVFCHLFCPPLFFFFFFQEIPFLFLRVEQDELGQLF